MMSAQIEYLEAVSNGIDVIEKIANGGNVLDNGAPAYWEDAEQFFRQAEWSVMEIENDLPPRPDQFQ